MQIIVITVADGTNPVEVQTWLNTNSNFQIISMTVKDNMFYILYK